MYFINQPENYMNGTEELIVLLFIFCCFALVLTVGGIVADYFEEDD